MPDQQDQDNHQKNQPHVFDRHTWSWMFFFFAVYYLTVGVLHNQSVELAYSEFKTAIANNQVESVTFQGDTIQGKYYQAKADGKQTFVTYIPEIGDNDLMPLLEKHSVTLKTKSSTSPTWLNLLLGIVPWLIIAAFFIYSSRMLQQRMGGAGGGMFGFAKSKARLYETADSEVSFKDVAGIENAKEDLNEIIHYLKEPEVFFKMGAKIPRGVLLMGPPGTGKTLIARATAAEAEVPFFSISGSEFIEMFVGVGASRVRDMFTEARKRSPSLIFVDEIDSVGRVRGTGLGGGSDEREQTLNQILAEMDGFNRDEAIVVIAATNRPDVLDPALLRPGRFDRKILLELPDREAREKILAVHASKIKLAEGVDLKELAGVSVGFSGADLANLVNEAALHAVHEHRESTSMSDFNFAHDKVVMGAERKALLNPDERRRIAVHESGHAVVARYLPDTDPLRQVSIIPRGMALGITEQLPEEERHNYPFPYLQSRLAIILGGRCAEQLIYGDTSTGAADDLKNVTQLAKRMVTQWGMSSKLGPIHYRIGDEHPFLGYELAQEKDFGGNTANLIDEEVRLLVEDAQQTATEALKNHNDQLLALTEKLLIEETLNKHQIEAILSADS